MTNRIQDAIDKMNTKLESVPIEEQETLAKQLETDFSDLCQYQNLQSRAFASGKLTIDEAQQLYRIYGGEVPSAEKWGKLSLAERVVGTRIAGELMGVKT